IYEDEVNSSSSTSHTTQNIAFVSSQNTDNTNESVSAVPNVSTASTKPPASILPNVDNLSDVFIYSFFATDLEDQSLDDLFNNLKIYEDEVKSSSSTSHTTQNIAFVSSQNTDNTNESVSAVPNVSTASTKPPASILPNVDNLSDVFIYSFFTNGHAYHESQEVSSMDWKESRSPKDTRNKDTQRRTIPVETSTSNALVS
nr:hypothetical protein [Tanacetum cinerariifolium]